MIDTKKIKIAMVEKNIRLKDIATKLNVSSSAVHQVIHNKAKSKKIEREIKQIIWGHE